MTAEPRPQGGGLRDIARGGMLNLIGAGVSSASVIGVTVVVTRHFSKPVAGVFFAATSVFVILTLMASLGASNGLVYFVARLRSLDDEGRISAMLRAAFRPAAAAAVLASVALVLAARPLAESLLGGHPSGGISISSVARALRTIAIALPFAALLDPLLSVARGYRDMRPTVLVDRFGRSLGQLLGVAIAAAAGSAVLLAPLWAAAYVPAAVAGWLWLRLLRQRETAKLAHSAMPGGRSARRALRRAPREFWRFTAPRSLATMAQTIIQRLDIVLVGILRGPAEAAIYTAATRFLVLGQFGNAAISLAAQPRLTELFSVGAYAGANRVYQATTAWLVVLTWPMYLLSMIFGPQILALFGHSYRAGYSVMIILGASMLMGTACGQVDVVLTTTGRSTWSLINGLSAMTVNIILDLLLIPRYGITGAAIGWAGALAVQNLVPLTQLALVAKLQPFGRSTLMACGLAAVSVGVIPLALRTGTHARAPVVVAAAGLGCLVYSAGLWLLRRPLELPI